MTLNEALLIVKNGEQYVLLLKYMFKDKKYSLTRGYVLQVFTEKLVEFRPACAKEIRRLYNNFLYKNYHPLEFLSLFL